MNPFGEAAESRGSAWEIEITDRKELEAELQERANLLAPICGQIPTGLSVTDRDGRHVRMSDSDIEPGLVD